MSCPSCAQPRFTAERGVCSGCQLADHVHASFRYRLGGVIFKRISASTLLCYHDCYGRVTYAVHVTPHA